MKPEIIYIIAVFVTFAVFEAFKTGFANKQGELPSDKTKEWVSSLILILGTQPLVLFLAYQLAAWLIPEQQNLLQNAPWWLALILFLLLDDMMQYWLHRTVHKSPNLYKLHRVHHDQAYLSVRVVYRNNVFYYLCMPSLWFSGTLIYLGLAEFYAYYIAVKMTVITAAHSDVHWDEKLYQIKWLRPVMWLLERIISTPSTHSAHHGRHKTDPGTHYKGNYGNLLFFWDVLFGTAKITRRYPVSYGVEKLPKSSTAEQLFWPLWNDKKSG